MKGGRTESCLVESRTLDRQKLVEIDKKYAVMTAAAQKRVASEL